MYTFTVTHNDYSNFGLLVTHRVHEIRNHSEPKQWHYVPSKLNVADDATRCVNVQNLQNNCRWFNGPKFIYKVNIEEYLTRNNINLDAEVDNAHINIVKIQATALKQNKLSINWHYFSNIDKLVRLLAWFLKLKHNWISWKRNKPEREHFNLLAFQELENARVILLRISQSESYPNDYNLLTTGRSLPQTSSLLTLTPVVKNGLICVGGRINHPHLPSSNNQIIICKSHPIAKLLVNECHEKNFHIGREHTLATVCKKIWIPACRGLIRKVLNDCLYCKRERIKPHVPLMSDLPQDRLDIHEKPFQNTGIDFLDQF